MKNYEISLVVKKCRGCLARRELQPSSVVLVLVASNEDDCAVVLVVVALDDDLVVVVPVAVHLNVDGQSL